MRHKFQANLTVQELEETYLPAFKACVMAGNSQQIMCSYNSIAVTGGDHPYNSTPACLDGDIIGRQMREGWGFKGNVVSDCDASSDAYTAHHWGPIIGDGGNASAAAVAVAGLTAGCDLDCGSFYTDRGNDAVSLGLLQNATIDQALTRVFTMRIRLGEFDPLETVPYNKLNVNDSDSPAHRESALRAARESIVLLNNSLRLLPVTPGPAAGAAAVGGGAGAVLKKKLKKLACIGILANSTRLNGGAPSGGVEMGGKNDYNPAFIASPLDGLRQVYQEGQHGVEVGYEKGLVGDTDMNTSLFPAAVALAKASDVTVVVVGLDGSNEGEGHDRQNITLLGAQLELVQALHAAVGVQRLVVVLVNGGQLSVDWIKRNCPTVIEALEGGQSGGVALAEIISGAVAPSGVLPYTMYPDDYLSQVVHQDMSMRKAPGRSYRFYTGEPLWPFGFSGSYTTWEMVWAQPQPQPRSPQDDDDDGMQQQQQSLAALPVQSLEEGILLRVRVYNRGTVDSAKALLFFASVELAGSSSDAEGHVETEQEDEKKEGAEQTTMATGRGDSSFKPPLRSLFAVEKVHVPAGASVEVVVNSTNLPGACAFCTVDESGMAAVRRGTYTITVGDGTRSEIKPLVLTAT